jgi:hypothetical protein
VYIYSSFVYDGSTGSPAKYIYVELREGERERELIDVITQRLAEQLHLLVSNAEPHKGPTTYSPLYPIFIPLAFFLFQCNKSEWKFVSAFFVVRSPRPVFLLILCAATPLRHNPSVTLDAGEATFEEGGKSLVVPYTTPTRPDHQSQLIGTHRLTGSRKSQTHTDNTGRESGIEWLLSKMGWWRRTKEERLRALRDTHPI